MNVTYLNGESQKILVEFFRATSQNVQSSLVSTLLKPVDGKFHSATKKEKNNYVHLSREMQYYLLG